MVLKCLCLTINKANKFTTGYTSYYGKPSSDYIGGGPAAPGYGSPEYRPDGGPR